jgi:pyruvate dehydrogenase E1 component alpha subunit
MSYVPPELFAEWEARDPVERYAARLIADLGFAAEEVEAIREEVHTLVAECAERALASPMPDPARAAEGVFADRWEALGDGVAPWSGWADSEARGGSPGGAGATGVERRAA